jgi:serine/threonine protein kinase
MNLATETVLTEGDALGAQPPLSSIELAPHFPQLEILECLGRGGMGVVYKARQKSLNRLVALKLLAPERVQDMKFAERFTREAQALAALNHPNIVTIYDFGQAGGFYFLLMEFVDGVNLRQLLRSRKLAPSEALAVVPPICEALQYAHDHGIVHRDIKPENLLLDKEGRVKIADFGIAKILGAEASNTGMAETQSAGTPQYMAPEQKSAPRTVDSRADIYSLGVVFYEMLTGELPGKQLEPPSRKVHIDVRLDEVVLRALEQKPELRFQQASEVKTCVETIANVGAANLQPALKSPFTHFIEGVFGISFKSRAAIKAANYSALGFLGCLSFLAYLPVPAMNRSWGFAGFYGFFGLIGVASLIEAVSQPRPKSNWLARTALVVVSLAAVLLAVLVFVARYVNAVSREHLANQVQENRKEDSSPARTAAAKLKLMQAETEVERLTKLHAQQLVSQSQLNEAKFALEIARAELKGDAKEVLRIRLREAEEGLERMTRLHDEHQASDSEFNKARFRVAIVKAELEGDGVEVIRNRVRQAEDELQRGSELHRQNLISESDYTKLQLELEILKMELTNALQRKAAP